MRGTTVFPSLLACQSMQLLFDFVVVFVFDFAFVFVLYETEQRDINERRTTNGREEVRGGRELTYKSSNGHSVWFGLDFGQLHLSARP